MPLNWMVSVFMVLMILLIMITIYGNKKMIFNSSLNEFSPLNKVITWSW